MKQILSNVLSIGHKSHSFHSCYYSEWPTFFDMHRILHFYQTHTHTHTFRHVFEHSVQHVSCHFGLQHIHLIRQCISVCMCNKFSIFLCIFLCGMCACILNLLAMHSVDIQGIMNTKMAIPKKWIILGMYFNSYF